METAIIVSIFVTSILGYTALLICIKILTGQIVETNRQLRYTVREYKIYQAATNGDMGTVRAMKSVFAGDEKTNGAAAKKLLEEVEKEEIQEASEFSEPVITQYG